MLFSGKQGLFSKRVFYSNQLIEFRDSFAPAAGTGLEVSCARRYGQVGNRRIFGFA